MWVDSDAVWTYFFLDKSLFAGVFNFSNNKKLNFQRNIRKKNFQSDSGQNFTISKYFFKGGKNSFDEK